MNMTSSSNKQTDFILAYEHGNLLGYQALIFSDDHLEREIDLGKKNDNLFTRGRKKDKSNWKVEKIMTNNLSPTRGTNQQGFRVIL